MRPWFEDLPLDFSRRETRTAEDLLRIGYPSSHAARTLAENSGLNPSDLALHRSSNDLIREILQHARRADCILSLLAEVLQDPAQRSIHEPLCRTVAGFEARIEAAALDSQPSLAGLALLPPSIEFRSPGKDARPLAGLEKVVNDAAGFSDVAVFRKRLAEAESRVARIEVNGRSRGTGFLIGQDLLLTNWHVVSGEVKIALARFDHKLTATGKSVSPGRRVMFAEAWRVAHSEHHGQIETSSEGPPSNKCDYAVVRLAEPVASQGIGGSPEAGRQARGHYTLDGDYYEFDRDEPLLVVGHPSGRPTQLSYASPSAARRTMYGSRVRYRTNTENGSSGSPVFNRHWRVVALHHAGGPTSTPGSFNAHLDEFNQGIPIDVVAASLRTALAGQRSLSELGLEPSGA